jgi:DNA-binding response OmpR family regulator
MSDPPDSRSASENISARTLSILLAEDDPNLRAMLAIILRREGHRVIELRNGAELRDRLEVFYARGQAAPANLLIISDLRMPEADGLSLVRATRARGHEPPFIILTAFGSPEVHAAAQAMGVLKVLDKPFDFDELRAVVRRFRACEPLS